MAINHSEISVVNRKKTIINKFFSDDGNFFLHISQSFF